MKDLDLRDDTVLIVEDEILIALALQNTLQAAGAIQVTLSTSIYEAEQIVGKEDYTLAILDVRLPDGQSYSLASKLIESKVPVVIHSGHADEREDEQLVKAVFCPKPSTPEQIMEAIVHAKNGM